MAKKKRIKQSAKTTLAEVTREMAKARVARSAREQSHMFGGTIMRPRRMGRGEQC